LTSDLSIRAVPQDENTSAIRIGRINEGHMRLSTAINNSN